MVVWQLEGYSAVMLTVSASKGMQHLHHITAFVSTYKLSFGTEEFT